MEAQLRLALLPLAGKAAEKAPLAPAAGVPVAAWAVIAQKHPAQTEDRTAPMAMMLLGKSFLPAHGAMVSAKGQQQENLANRPARFILAAAAVVLMTPEIQTPEAAGLAAVVAAGGMALPGLMAEQITAAAVALATNLLRQAEGLLPALAAPVS